MQGWSVSSPPARAKLSPRRGEDTAPYLCCFESASIGVHLRLNLRSPSLPSPTRARGGRRNSLFFETSRAWGEFQPWVGDEAVNRPAMHQPLEPMPCPEFEDRLLSREELSAAERESVDAHLEVLST